MLAAPLTTFAEELQLLQAMQMSMTYEEHRRTLIEYLKAKVELADWHAVWDSAMDLRVLEAQQAVLEQKT